MNFIPVAITVLLAGAALPCVPRTFVITAAAAQDAGTPDWVQAGDMHAARTDHTATLLWNGKVLVVGGGLAGTSTELYDPLRRSWSASGSLSAPLGGHTATPLPDGKVLVAGGYTSTADLYQVSAAAYEYDPATGTWSLAGDMAHARHGHTATMLESGKILVAGGYDADYVADAELYDPQSRTWSSAGRLLHVRWLHSATRLHDGTVLVAGGSDDPGDGFSPISSAEIYDAATNTWRATDRLSRPRYDHVATLLPDGRLMIAGGWGGQAFDGGGYQSVTLNSTELYDPATRSWTATSPLVGGQAGINASALPDGTILVSGGYRSSDGEFATAAYRYHPDNATWTSAGNLHAGHYGHTATVLSNGDVLVAGGVGDTWAPPLESTELYTAAGSTPVAVNPDQHGLTGAWANPATAGQGLVMEVYPDVDRAGRGALFGGWFTFDAAIAGGQRWYTIQGSVDTAAPVTAVSIYQSEGGAFDSPQVTTTTEVGQATLQFSDCMHGTLDYHFSDGSGRSGTVPLGRLLQNVSCTPGGDSGSAASTYLLSGAWADADGSSGQGLVLDVHPAQDVLFAAWYTFADDATPSSGAGGQHWYTLQAQTTPGTRDVDGIGIYDTRGGQFDRPAATGTVPVGSARLVFHHCGSATLSYRFHAGRSGTLDLARVGPTPPGCAL